MKSQRLIIAALLLGGAALLTPLAFLMLRGSDHPSWTPIFWVFGTWTFLIFFGALSSFLSRSKPDDET